MDWPRSKEISLSCTFCLARAPYRSFYLDQYLRLCLTPYPSCYTEPHPSVLPHASPESVPEPYRSMLPRISPEGLPRLYPDTYPIRLTQPNYLTLILSRPDFCLSDSTRPPHSTSLPDWVTFHCPRLLTQPYPITFPGRVPFNWPYPKTSSSASQRDLGLFWSIMHQDCSDNPWSGPDNLICLIRDQICLTWA
jgi:hypothetical protein